VSEKSFNAIPSSKGEFVRIFIEDNGIGFDESYLDKIFTIFQRLHVRSDYEGTGIGLAIVKKIVEKHDGIIGAKSKEGVGATFFMILPIHQKNAQVTAA
jgi:signal transduction histidine kinase